MEIIQNTRKPVKKRVQVDIDRDLVEKAESILDVLQISQASLIKSLYSRLVAQGGVPFDMSLTEKEKASMMLSSTIDKYIDTTQNVNHIKTQSDFNDWLNEYDE
jgi:hypothetical protein